MNDMTSNVTLSAAEHASAMVEYIAEGTRRAYALGNGGPIRMGLDGKLHRDILDAYWKLGFYVFEGGVGAEELAELRPISIGCSITRRQHRSPNTTPGAGRRSDASSRAYRIDLRNH